MTFSTFWQSWPNKVAKVHAEKMWNRLTPDEQAKAIQVLPAHIQYWAKRGGAQFIPETPHPGSWLSGKRFEDELPILPNVAYVSRDTYIPIPKPEDCCPNPMRKR